MVGRLVQQQQVGLEEQRAGQRHAHPPAAGDTRRSAAPAPPRRSRGRRGSWRRGPARCRRRWRSGARGSRPARWRLGVALQPRPAARRARCRRRARSSSRLSGPPGASCATWPRRARAARRISPPSGCDLAGDRLAAGWTCRRRCARPARRWRPGSTHEVGAVQQRAAGDAEGEVADGQDGHAEGRVRRCAGLSFSGRAGRAAPRRAVVLRFMRAVGVEPTLCCQNRILSPARLPIPPRPQRKRRRGGAGLAAGVNAMPGRPGPGFSGRLPGRSMPTNALR